MIPDFLLRSIQFLLEYMKKILKIYNSKFISIFLPLVKNFFIALQIVFYIIKYYLGKGFYFISKYFQNKVFWLEFKNLLPIIIFSFFIYYFIIIELSILVFGYSLLCYWFAFVMVIFFLIIAWQLEINFIKEQLRIKFNIKLQIWVDFYNGKNPLSLYDFLTFYKNKPLFWFLIIDQKENEIHNGRLSLFVFYSFLFFFFIYSCSYRFDPRFVHFVARYFHPVVNFFETWKNPRLEDFMSALVRFWNWLFVYFEIKHITSDQINLIKKLTKPGARLEDWANVQWSYKISLRKHTWFSDIYFLRTLHQYPAVSWLVFDLEQPTSTATWMDQNWKLLFLRYVTEQYSTLNQNFWKKHFFNNRIFWNLINEYKTNLNDDVTRVEQTVIKNYQKTSKFSQTPFELLLEENYFDNVKQPNISFFERYGTNRDFYFNLLRHSKIEKIPVKTNLKEIFLSPAYYSPAYTLTGLINFQRRNKNNSRWKKNFWKENSMFLNLLLVQLKNKNLLEVKEMLDFDLDVSLNSYSNYEIFKKLKPKSPKFLFWWPMTNRWLYKIYLNYNVWLNALENVLQISDTVIPYRWGRFISLGFLTNIMHKWLDQLENVVYDWDFPTFMGTQLPTYEDFRYVYLWFLDPVLFYWLFKWKMLKDFGYKEKQLKQMEAHLFKPFLLKFSTWEITSFVEAERWLQKLERLAGLRPASFFKNKKKHRWRFLAQNIKNPWFIKSLQYFSTWDYRSVLPGFVWYYYPTPFPTTFSTFGFGWNKYQFFWKNTMSTIVGYSDSLAELRNSTPLALYSGVEAIMYIKPLLDIFDFFIKIFIKILTYPIEILVTRESNSPLSSVFSLAFFAHFVWFIHFYIYTFIFLYLLYYFFVYYYKKIGFKWFYEWTFEETILTSYNNRIFWHSLIDIWKYYRTPEQLLLLNLHTNLLMHYTFPFYTNYFVLQNNKMNNFVKVLINFLKNYNSLKNFSFFIKIYNNDKKKLNLQKDQDYFLFRSFFNGVFLRHSPLFFLGGSDISFDHLIWSYFDYLNQISHYINWALLLNYYKISENNKFSHLMWQFTVLASSMSLQTDFMFLSQPLLDTILSRKLILNLILFLWKETNEESGFFYSFQKLTAEVKLPLSYSLILGQKLEFYNFFITSGLDIYKQFEFLNLPNLTKLGSFDFWNDKRYWTLAFLRSFRFVSKFSYPNSNLHLNYEDTQRHLSRIAYANSWISQSTYVWPFFNLIQHIWWTSHYYTRAQGLLSSPFNVTQPGISVLDQTRNFYEKRYSFQFSTKIETIFGFVKSLDLTKNYFRSNYGLAPFENKNFDLSFPEPLFKHKTTSRSYLKTNPPVNLLELNITPYSLFKLFQKLPISQIIFYFTFLTQIKTLDKSFNLLDWDLTKEFKQLDVYASATNKSNPELYAAYDFYLKKFDFLLKFSQKNILKNFVFSFDISYFLSHFTTYDNFTSTLTDHWPNSLKLNETYTFDNQQLNLLMANQEILTKLDNFETWFEKPFGVLDKLELHSLRTYKLVKQLDTGSFSWNRDDPFLNLDVEHTQQGVGYSNYPKEDKKNLFQTYNENILNFWQKWFPYNPTIVKNSTTKFLVGWVGEMYTNTLAATNLLHSLLYASPQVSLRAWDTPNIAFERNILINSKNRKIFSFFAKSNFQLQLFAKAFSWLNLILHPSSYRYTLGPKAASRLDYWSWKCGLTLDYQNGFYSYRPYLGFWHSFSSRLTTYDPLYGFYKTYRQISDNPLLIDPSTGAVHKFKGSDEENFFEEDLDSQINVKWMPTQNYDPAFNKEFSLPYRELYYSLQHPYFIGYLYFWLLIITSNTIYLGLSNFSLKWFLLREFFRVNLIINYNTYPLINNRENAENKFWKQMSNYWRYYINPIKLTSYADCTLDDELFQPIDNTNSMFKFYLMNNYLLTYLTDYLNFKTADIIYILDFKKFYRGLIVTNWLTLDLPFTLNPYLVTNFDKLALQFNDANSLIYKLNFFNFSKFNTLKETINFNLFYDWSSGTYLDTINFISYTSTCRGSGMLNNIFFENPAYVAATFLWYNTDKSYEIAQSFHRQKTNFLYHDILVGNDLALHNFSLVSFFTESLDFLLTLESSFPVKLTFLNFLKFYFKSSFFDTLTMLKLKCPPEIDSKILNHDISKMSKLKKLVFLYKLQWNLTHDILINLISTGLFFTNWNRLRIFFKSIWFWLSSRYNFLWNYYQKIGKYLTFYFFIKK